MTFLPLIERELRLRARSPAAYWTRFAVGVAGMLICLPQFTLSAYATPATVGRGVFNGLVSAAFLLICVACLLTLGALHNEQQEGTLGLLLLTRVRVLDVLVGKLGSIGLTSFCVLVAFLPMLMLPVLSGGVSGGEVFRKELGLLNTLFFALTAGLFASASQKERFKAARLAVLIVGTIALVPFLAGVMLGRTGSSAAPPLPVRLSPLVLLISAGDLPYRTSPGSYWSSMAILSALSGLLLAAACGRLRQAVRGEGDRIILLLTGSFGWLRRAVRGQEDTPTSPAGSSSGIDERIRRPRRRRRFSGVASPVAWRVSGQRGLRAAFWAAALVGFLYYGLFGFLLRFWGMSSVALASWSFNLASAAIVGALCAWAASRFFIESRRTGELELLLTTPVGAQTIVSDQWKVLKQVVRWPLVFMVLPMFLPAVYILVLPRAQFGGARLFYAIYIPLSALNTVFGLVALCWVALWFGVRAGGQARAILWTVGVAKALPYGLSVLFSVVGTMLFTPRPMPFFHSYWVFWFLPQVLTIVFYLWLIRLARRRLPGEVAAPRPMQFAFGQTFSSRAREAGAALRAARHWTPS